jgi:hypothetical protein
MLRHGSLFSGIGGFDLAAEWAGWENVFHCERMEALKAYGNAIVPQVALQIFNAINEYEKLRT